MTNISVLENKISSIRKYLKLLDRYKGYTQNQIEENVDRKGAIERYLYLAVQASIDLAEAYISHKDFRKPSTFSECFHILNQNEILSSEFTQKLVKMAGFRNILAHDYEDLNFSIVYDVLQNRVRDIEKFANLIEKQLKS